MSTNNVSDMNKTNRRKNIIDDKYPLQDNNKL